jgi:hypothetical protein
MIKFSENDPPPSSDEKSEEEKTDDKETTSDPENPVETKKENEVVTPEIFDSETSWLCCTTYKDRSRFKNILQYLELSPVKKEIIKTRYLDILQNLQKRSRNHGILFFIGHFIITVGSLFVPALLSIQNSDKEYALVTGAFNVHIYWATFTISLLVTIWNGILTLFQIDKKYYFLNTILECLRSEGWQYMSLTGRYSGSLIRGKKPTHDNQFIHFTHYIEKIKMKQIEEEYYRTDDKTQAPNSAAPQTTRPANQPNVPANPTVYPTIMVDGYPQSLDKPLSTIGQQAMPDSVRNAYETLTQTQQQPYYGLGSSMPFSVLQSGYHEPSYRYSSMARPTVIEKPVVVEKIVEKPIYIEVAVPVSVPIKPDSLPSQEPSPPQEPLAASQEPLAPSQEPSTPPQLSRPASSSPLPQLAPLEISSTIPNEIKDSSHVSFRDMRKKLKENHAK